MFLKLLKDLFFVLSLLICGGFYSNFQAHSLLDTAEIEAPLLSLG